MDRSRREFIRKIGLGVGVCVLTGTIDAAEKAKPNILFIMSDDHTTQAVGAYATLLKDVVKTPNIDRLAREGALLEKCFCTNSICTPSRAAILTGQYSQKNGVYTLDNSINPAHPNVAKHLQRAGYQTAIIGKWHLKTEPSGFDYWNVLPGQGRYNNPVMKSIDKGQEVHPGFSTDVITDLSMDWLKKRGKSDPFFLMTHFKNCHAPRDYADRHEHLYDGVTIPEPDSLFEDLSHRSDGSREYGFTVLDPLFQRLTAKNNATGQLIVSDSLSDKEKVRVTYQKYLKDYLRCVVGIDENVGRLLDYLDQAGLAENTIVCYTSDQGFYLGEHGYIDKRWMYEESLRMPFLIRFPKRIAPGKKNDDIVLNVDFAPLFLDVAGEKTPDVMQGRSFLKNLTDETPKDWRKSMYYRYWMHCSRPAHYGVRTKKHKLIFFYGLPLDARGAQKPPSKPGWELYDLEKDPRELKNVYGDRAYAGVVKELKVELLRLKKELGDTDDKYPELMKLRGKVWDL